MSAPLRHGLLALVLLATVLAFAPGLSNGFAWDDEALVRDNAYLAAPTHLPGLLTHDFWDVSAASELSAVRSFYRPVVTLALFAERQLFGLRPFGYHLVNVLLHLACVVLAWRWLSRRVPGSGAARDVALAAGTLLFALHPSRGEVVSWISGATELWWTLLLLAGFECFGGSNRAGRVTGTVVLFVLALLSKETAATGAALLVTDTLLLGDPTDRPRRVDAFITVGAMSVAVALRLLAGPFAGAARPPLADALVHLFASLGTYASHVVACVPPSVSVALDLPGRGGSGPTIVGAGVVLAVAGVAALARRRPGLRPVLADLLWWVLPLLPVSGVFQLGSQPLAERYLYVPLLGVCSLVVRGLVGLAANRRSYALATGAVSVLAVGGGVVCAATASRFSSSAALWSYEETNDPTNGYFAFRRAKVALREHDLALAWQELARAVELAPTDAAKGAVTLEAAGLFVRAAPDTDQPTLVALRTFLDDLSGGGGPAATMTYGGATITLPARVVAVGPELPFELHLRTHDVPGALDIARAWQAAQPSSAEAKDALERASAALK